MIGNVVTTAQFSPFSYAELLAPVQAATEEHKAIDEGLATLDAEADRYRQYIERNPTSPIAIQYQNYIDELDRAATELSQNGLTPQSRSNLNKLRRNYTGTIEPIKTRVENYQKWSEYKAKNPNLIGTLDINDFLNDINFTPQFYNGDDLVKSIGEEATIMASRKPYVQEGSILNGSKFIISQGYTPQEIDAALQNQEGELGALVAKGRAAAGYDNLSPADKIQVDTLIRNAITNKGLQRNVVMDNPDYLDPKDIAQIENMRQDNARAWAALRAKSSGSTSGEGTTTQIVYDKNGNPITQVLTKSGYRAFDAQGNPVLKWTDTNNVTYQSDGTGYYTHSSGKAEKIAPEEKSYSRYSSDGAYIGTLTKESTGKDKTAFIEATKGKGTRITYSTATKDQKTAMALYLGKDRGDVTADDFKRNVMTKSQSGELFITESDEVPRQIDTGWRAPYQVTPPKERPTYSNREQVGLP